MSAVQYFTACTLDGFIADENNSLDWLFEVPHDADDQYWDRWFPGVGGLVMGATTYEWMLERYGLADSTERWRGKGAPLLPRRITSKNLAFRTAELIGQRVRIVIDVRP
jgi:dihydrofolate reductase